jgi:hypothetical protein
VRGIIYFGGYHFTERLFDLHGNVWFYDGRTSGDTCDVEGKLGDFNMKQLIICGSRKAVLAIYAAA